MHLSTVQKATMTAFEELKAIQADIVLLTKQKDTLSQWVSEQRRVLGSIEKEITSKEQVLQKIFSQLETEKNNFSLQRSRYDSEYERLISREKEIIWRIESLKQELILQESIEIPDRQKEIEVIDASIKEKRATVWELDTDIKSKEKILIGLDTEIIKRQAESNKRQEALNKKEEQLRKKEEFLQKRESRIKGLLDKKKTNG